MRVPVLEALEGESVCDVCGLHCHGTAFHATSGGRYRIGDVGACGLGACASVRWPSRAPVWWSERQAAAVPQQYPQVPT